MTPEQFVQTLQLADSLFPVGSFAYSDGMETAAADNPDSVDFLTGWLHHYLDAVFVPCDGLALLKCLHAIDRNDWRAIQTIDEELTALRPAAAVRASSKSIGKGLLKMYDAIAPDGARRPVTLQDCNAAVAYGIVFAYSGLDFRGALLAFGYTRLAGMVSAALRLTSLGQQRGQAILANALNRLTEAVDCVIQSESEPLRSFSPMLDIQQMNHRFVYSRLFRS
jgi:urease accessory protein